MKATYIGKNDVDSIRKFKIRIRDSMDSYLNQSPASGIRTPVSKPKTGSGYKPEAHQNHGG
jgi:hypothetical protein